MDMLAYCGCTVFDSINMSRIDLTVVDVIAIVCFDSLDDGSELQEWLFSRVTGLLCHRNSTGLIGYLLADCWATRDSLTWPSYFVDLT